MSTHYDFWLGQTHTRNERGFAALDLETLQNCFGRWVKAVAQLSQGEIIAIDGKTLRHSDDSAQGKGAIHRVSAWATQRFSTEYVKCLLLMPAKVVWGCSPG